MPNQHTEERLSSAQAARIAKLPGRWSRTKLSRRLHFCEGEKRVTLCGISGAYPNGKSWAEVDPRGACNRCIRLLPTLCPEPSAPAPTPAGVSSASPLGS